MASTGLSGLTLYLCTGLPYLCLLTGHPHFLAFKTLSFIYFDQLFQTVSYSLMYEIFFFDFFSFYLKVAELLLISHFICLVLLLSQEELTALIIRAVQSWNLLNQTSMLMVNMLLEKQGS